MPLLLFSLHIVGGDDMKYYEFFNQKGYIVPDGYMGWTGKRYQLFATEEEYDDWYTETIWNRFVKY